MAPPSLGEEAKGVKRTDRLHSAHEISPRARLSSMSSSVLILRELRRGSAGMSLGGRV